MNNLRHIIRDLILEMAVRQDILDSVRGTRKKTMLLGKKLDFSTWSDGRRYQSSYGNQIKPNGLWYGYGSEWVDFAMDPANKGLSGMVTGADYFYELDVHYTTLENPNKDKVLLLRNYEDAGKLSELIDGELNRVGGMMMANWYAISALFGGLEVADGLESYFGWDIPSGCIWSKNAIKSINLIQDPETMEGIPRGAKALGINFTFDPDAKTFADIDNEKILELIEEYDDDFHWEGHAEYESEEALKDGAENIWDALQVAYNFEEEDWFEAAVDGRHRNIYPRQMLSAGIWLITHFRERDGSYWGVSGMPPRLPRDADYSDVLDNINAYLTRVSNELNLGLGNIDLDADGTWDNAVSAEMAAEYGY